MGRKREERDRPAGAPARLHARTRAAGRPGPEVAPAHRAPPPGTRRRCALSAALLLMMGLGISAVALAACPVLDPENTWLGVLTSWRKRGLSAAQIEAFVRQGAVPRYPVTLWPPSGPAPLLVGLVWQERGPGVQGVEVDFDGDGTVDLADSRDENIAHTYTAPGEYPARIRVRRANGEAATYASPVSVLTPGAFDAELKGRWDSLKSAVERGDILAAFECLYSMARSPRHEHLLRSLLRGPVEEHLPPIRLAEFIVMEARYETIRPTPRHTRPMGVRFQPDLDGVWRVISILPEVPP